MFGRQKVKTVEGLPNLMYKRNKRKKHVWRAKSKMILSCQPQWVEPGCEKGGSPSDSSVGSAEPRGYTGIYRHILIYTGSTGCIYRIELYRDEKDKQFRWVSWTRRSYWHILIYT